MSHQPTSKPVGFMQSCCALWIFSRWLPLVWFTRPSVLIVKLIAETQANICLSCPISCSTTPGDMRMSSVHRPHIVHMLSAHHLHAHTSSTCHLHTHTSSTCHPHTHTSSTCHLHIICSTPHGHCGTKLSFYCDRNWLLNWICHKNVELFHFRII